MGFMRKYLSADGLLQVVRHCVGKAKLENVIGATYSWEDCVMSGLAVFGLKCASLLQFERLNDIND